LWYKIKKIDPIYARFLTSKQAKDLDLPTVVTKTPLAESKENSVVVSRREDQTEDLSDGDTVIFMIPPLLDSRSELPDHYHNPHRLP
jgi:hypothetical protein